MVAFSDLSNDERMRLRGILEDAGGYITGYYGGHIQVAIPRPSALFYSAIDPHFEMVPGSLHYFPLGSDVNYTPDNLRHDGRYPGSRGFWLFASFHQR